VVCFKVPLVIRGDLLGKDFVKFIGYSQYRWHSYPESSRIHVTRSTSELTHPVIFRTCIGAWSSTKPHSRPSIYKCLYFTGFDVLTQIYICASSGIQTHVFDRILQQFTYENLIQCCYYSGFHPWFKSTSTDDVQKSRNNELIEHFPTSVAPQSYKWVLASSGILCLRRFSTDFFLQCEVGSLTPNPQLGTPSLRIYTRPGDKVAQLYPRTLGSSGTSGSPFPALMWAPGGNATSLELFQVSLFCLERPSTFSDVIFGVLNLVTQGLDSFGRGISSSQRPLPTKDSTIYKHERQTSMPPAGFEPAIPAIRRSRPSLSSRGHRDRLPFKIMLQKSDVYFRVPI
jgi:hypothetical protein